VNRHDRLMVAALAERPPRIAPPLPDVPAPNDYPFAGSATGHVQRWRARAERAEAALAQVSRVLNTPGGRSV
jgi:hypothetical protein